MISQLTGLIVEIQSDHLVLDVNGVGYEVMCSLNTLASVQVSRTEKSQTFYIYTHVREDLLQLFGFESRMEKQLFLSLLRVNGVGPKSALAVLSGATCEQIMEMIEAGDAKALARLPKLGKKTAEQIVLTLKGQLVWASADESGAASGSAKKGSKTSLVAKTGVSAEISSALVNLGFRPQDVDQVVRGLGSKMDFEEGVRQGLQLLTQAQT